MKYKNLRDFIAYLEEKGELRRISTPVTWDLEITEVCDRVTKSGGPALLFENVEGSNVPVLINAFGSERRMAWALGAESLEGLADRVRGLLGLVEGPPKGVMEKVRALGQLMKVASVRPKVVRSAPCQEVVIQGDDVDVTRFPILKCWPEDAGRYITLAPGHYQGPGNRRPQRGHVQDAGVRWAYLRHALADAESRARPLSRLW